MHFQRDALDSSPLAFSNRVLAHGQALSTLFNRNSYCETRLAYFLGRPAILGASCAMISCERR